MPFPTRNEKEMALFLWGTQAEHKNTLLTVLYSKEGIYYFLENLLLIVLSSIRILSTSRLRYLNRGSVSIENTTNSMMHLADMPVIANMLLKIVAPSSNPRIHPSHISHLNISIGLLI